MAHDVDFELFIAHSLDMFCVAGVDGMFRWLSPRWTEVLGWSEAKLLSTPFLEFVHPDDVPATLAVVDSLAAGELNISFTNRYRCADGGYKWLEWVGRPLPDGTLYSTARDVTARQHRTEKLEEQHSRMQLAEEMAAVGHWRLDVESHELYWSPVVYRIHGLDPDVYVPTVETAVNAYHPDDRQRVETLVQRAVEAQEPFEFQLRIVRPDGEVRLVDSMGQCHVNPQKELVSVFGVFRDVTERFGEFRSRNEALESFAHAAAHDLQAPLRTVVGFGEMAQRAMDEQNLTKAREYMQRVLTQTRAMTLTIDELLRYARSTATDEDWERVMLRPLLSEVTDGLHASIEASGAAIEVSGDGAVLGMPVQLRMLFQNLLQNAIKYSSQERSPRISLALDRCGRHIQAVCADNGIGFNPRRATNLFRPFGRLAGAPNVAEGMGMGLAICKRIVDAHGGEIVADAVPGEGATFTVTLPVA